ncbi:MAG: hypothetical protein ACRDEA_03100, partial [Microcystaceae cyanobacterium]
MRKARLWDSSRKDFYRPVSVRLKRTLSFSQIFRTTVVDIEGEDFLGLSLTILKAFRLLLSYITNARMHFLWILLLSTT